jgi:cytochrome c-type biogenesis protein CcmH
MFAFWIAAAALSAAVGWLMLSGSRAALLRTAGEDPAVAMHRRQLAERAELAARGLLPEAEVTAARAEAGRRLLAAADRAPRTAGADGRRLAVAAAVVAPLLAVAAYLAVGTPGADDQPYSKRLAEWRAGDPARLDPPRMAAVLRAVSAERPNDPAVFRNLALAEMAAGDTMAAGAALRRAVRLAPGDAGLWAALGETFMMQAEGRIDADARTAFGEALKRDPANMSARYFLARADIQDGKVTEGLAGWRALLATLPPDDGNRTILAGEIAAVEKTGALPQAAPEPRAQPMPDNAAIRGMVEGLAARLEADPMDPQGWVRLVRAWSVLGETGRRDAARAKARDLFKDKPEVLKALDQAAEAPR